MRPETAWGLDVGVEQQLVQGLRAGINFFYTRYRDLVDFDFESFQNINRSSVESRGVERRCCTARSKSLTSLCRLQSHPAQYVSGIPSAAILLSISHPIRCSTRCLANVRARISGPMIAL